MKIMVLPGTIWQVPLMKKIKALGHELYLTNPIDNKDVTEIADHFFQSDIFAYDNVISYCKSEGIDVVMSEECDIATDVVAKYNKELGANCISSEIAELFTNKYRMREFCRTNGINPIPHKLCNTVEEACEFLKEHGPKLIMKPLDSNASHGVFTVCSEQEILENFAETLKFSRNYKAVLLERYIEGTEFTVDGIMTYKGHVTLAISEKTHYAHNDNIANSLLFTQHNPQYDYSLLRKTNDELINATGLTFGLTHVEYKYMDGKFYLIEMAARGGGNLISAIIAPFMGGVDNYEYLIKCTLDKDYRFEIHPDIDNDKTAILKFLDLQCDRGVVRSIHGENYLSTDNRIKSYKLNFKVGDSIKQPDNDSVRIGYYIICADSKEEVDEVINNINEQFYIEVSEQ